MGTTGSFLRSALQRRTFTSPLLSTAIESTNGGTCRVCGGAIERGELVLFRAWHTEIAHVACGYVRRGEDEPHECRKPGTFTAYWEWRCPACGLDACALRAPRDGDPRECGRCAPPPPVEAGVVVETLSAMVFRGPVKRGRVTSKCVERHTRAIVLSTRDDLAELQWLDEVDAPAKVVVRKTSLTPLFRRAG